MDDRLSQIDTMWSVVQQAHRQEATQFAAAQQQMLDRYGGAVRRYALAALRDPEAADEVFQEFALKFVRGDYGKADPTKGRFRSFLKTSLYHLIVDYQRKRVKQQKQAGPLMADTPDVAESYQAPDDEAFLTSWRDELLSRVWQELEKVELTTGKPYHTVLRMRVENPDVRSPELAEIVSRVLNKPMKAGAVRTSLHRAREKFGDLLIDEVAHSLSNATPESVEQELIELDLWQYCKPALERREESGEE
ncbi:sigma-70 family RNA polymerase sigma factor [Aeoliella sp. ICT_H6.2]|uniref:Sigma-70 family RNA polymerase sigma factor n=1 Tax=Aeoliella straminimaris TaxID=2954799 RepID=A0A9X2JH82_9BACT|nr:sigma-70 family RNA polymerase sigma factor [Aeoliella straminimaris]MCO6045192.1 sigma-70 family RNA polymerase sigma factor [Aeoliella straminimaris]